MCIRDRYHYSENGTIEAQKLSVSDIREKKEYEKILAQYINLRTIYQSVLLLDYQYDQNADEHMTIATEYEKILDDILKASTQIKALDIDSKYVQLQSMMLSWVDSQNEQSIYTYCKLMSAGITENLSIIHIQMCIRDRCIWGFIRNSFITKKNTRTS